MKRARAFTNVRKIAIDNNSGIQNINFTQSEKKHAGCLKKTRPTLVLLNFSGRKHVRMLVYISFETQDPQVHLKYKNIFVRYQEANI